MAVELGGTPFVFRTAETSLARVLLLGDRLGGLEESTKSRTNELVAVPPLMYWFATPRKLVPFKPLNKASMPLWVSLGHAVGAPHQMAYVLSAVRTGPPWSMRLLPPPWW